jgi:hypothetical protein
MIRARPALPLLIAIAACWLWTAPAAATAYCNVLKGEDGFAPLRQRPEDSAPVIVRMREDDEVQLLEGSIGAWREVMHWHGQDRQDEIRRADVRRGWVHERHLGDCG